LASYDIAISIKPDYAEAFSNRGNVLKELKRFDEALASYNKAIEQKPDYSEAYVNRSLVRLLLGDFERGFVDYEWRKIKKNTIINKAYVQPLLTSLSDAKSKIIFVHWEQGLGDTIQFCRFIDYLVERGARVLFGCQTNLHQLLRSLNENVSFIDGNHQTIIFDFHIPLMSLALLFKTTIDTVPSKNPYLKADQNLIEKFKSILTDEGFKIGICWKGSSTYKDDINRSFSVELFEDLSKISGVRLISLHKGEGEDQLTNLPNGMIVETLGSDFDSGPDAFLDTAAVMMNLDLVITSDTSIAHLGGALGVPVWVALKFIPDWRWMLDRADSPWYPTMRLFRQKSDGDWQRVFEEMKTEVLELTTGVPLSNDYKTPDKTL
jgi:hypothetical protein